VNTTRCSVVATTPIPLGFGYKYSGPTGGDGDPVKRVHVKRTPGGRAFVKFIIKGDTGTQSLDVVPPNAGDDGGFILTIPGGGTYCATVGDAPFSNPTMLAAQRTD